MQNCTVPPMESALFEVRIYVLASAFVVCVKQQDNA